MVTETSLSGVPQVGVRAKATSAQAVEPAAMRQEAAAGGTELPASERAEFDPKALAEAVNRLNEHVQNLQRSLKFSVDEGTGHTVITVIDRDTNEVIRQIPSEETIEILSRLQAATGLLLSEQV